MSSYEHVRGSSPARSEHKNMSFNPVRKWVPPAAKEEPMGAFEVSKRKRIRKCCLHSFYDSMLTPTRCSTSRPRRHLLSPRRWGRLWVCSNKTGPG